MLSLADRTDFEPKTQKVDGKTGEAILREAVSVNLPSQQLLFGPFEKTLHPAWYCFTIWNGSESKKIVIYGPCLERPAPDWIAKIQAKGYASLFDAFQRIRKDLDRIALEH